MPLVEELEKLWNYPIICSMGNILRDHSSHDEKSSLGIIEAVHLIRALFNGKP